MCTDFLRGFCLFQRKAEQKNTKIMSVKTGIKNGGYNSKTSHFPSFKNSLSLKIAKYFLIPPFKAFILKLGQLSIFLPIYPLYRPCLKSSYVLHSGLLSRQFQEFSNTTGIQKSLWLCITSMIWKGGGLYLTVTFP